jgi:hypothetical protein
MTATPSSEFVRQLRRDRARLVAALEQVLTELEAAARFARLALGPQPPDDEELP